MKTIKDIKKLSELRWRLKLWKRVLTIMNREEKDTSIRNGLCAYVKAATISFLTEDLHPNLPAYTLVDEREHYPELLAHKPKNYWKERMFGRYTYTSYWFNPFSIAGFEKRMEIVKSIIRELDCEIAKRTSEEKQRVIRLELWKNVRAAMIEDGWNGTSGLCRLINLYRFVANIEIAPRADEDTNRINYPEMHKYFPGYYIAGSYYWWKPNSVEGYEKRLKVVDNIIRDLSKNKKN